MRVACRACGTQYDVDDDTDLKALECPACKYRNCWRKVELVPCPECQQIICKDAPLCPHCGRQVRPLLTSPDVKRISTGWVLACAAAFALIHIALVWVVIDQTVGKIGRAMTPQRQTFHTAAKPTQEEIMQNTAYDLRQAGRFSQVEVRGDSFYARVSTDRFDQVAYSLMRGYVRSASHRLKLAGLPSEVYGAVIPAAEPIPPKVAYYEVIAKDGEITKQSTPKSSQNVAKPKK